MAWFGVIINGFEIYWLLHGDVLGSKIDSIGKGSCLVSPLLTGIFSNYLH